MKRNDREVNSIKTLKSILFGKRVMILALTFGLAVSGCASLLGGKNDPNSNKVTPVPAPTEATPVSQPTPAKQESSILFIIDSSGSMKTKAGGKTKMDAAKEVVTELIGQLPAGVQAGLMAYGHRQKNDCKDIELLVPIGPVNEDVFSQKVNSLQPLGETPISASIRQAADVLKGLPGKKTVILISDGEESCKEDPCTVAAELKKADVDLQIHVVGFGIDKPIAKKQLNCIAEATGGTYKDAGNAAELKKTLEGMAKAAESTGDKGRLVTVVTDVEGNQIDYNHVEFYRPGQDDTEISRELGVIMPVPTSLWKVPVPPGTYDIKYWAYKLPTIWKRGVEIKAGQETIVEIGHFGRARFVVKDQNGNELDIYKEAYIGGTRFSSTTGYEQSLNLPPGTYDFYFWATGLPEAWRRGVEIKSGDETLVEVTINK